MRWTRATTSNALGRLVSYDLLILWRSAQAAFSRKRDISLLLVAVTIGLLIALQRGREAAAAVDALPLLAKAGLAAAAAFATNLAAARRQAHLREGSVVARFALRPAEARAHRLLWNAPALCVALGLVLLSSSRLEAVVAIAIAYPLGMGFAAAQRAAARGFRKWRARRRAALGTRRVELAGEGRRHRTLRLLTARIGPLGPRIAANLIACACAGVLIGTAHGLLATQLRQPAAAVIAGLVLLLLLLAFLRTHPPLLRYLSYLGNEPLLPALVATFLAAALAAGLLIGLMASPPAPLPAMVAGAGVVVLLFLAAASLRTFHYQTKSRQMAEFAIQIDVVAAGLAGLLAPPLAPLLLLGRLWFLRRQARGMRYLSP